MFHAGRWTAYLGAALAIQSFIVWTESSATWTAGWREPECLLDGILPVIAKNMNVHHIHVITAMRLGITQNFIMWEFIIKNYGNGFATNGMCIFPTSTKEVEFAPEWHGTLEIHAEKLTIDCGENIALWCTSKGGITCPKFSWSVSGTGFYLGAIGSKTDETETELEIIQLLADANACGTATIELNG